MAELAKSQKALSETETKQQLKRDEAELLKIRTDLAAAADKNNEHINSDFKPPLEQRGACVLRSLPCCPLWVLPPYKVCAPV